MSIFGSSGSATATDAATRAATVAASKVALRETARQLRLDRAGEIGRHGLLGLEHLCVLVEDHGQARVREARLGMPGDDQVGLLRVEARALGSGQLARGLRATGPVSAEIGEL